MTGRFMVPSFLDLSVMRRLGRDTTVKNGRNAGLCWYSTMTAKEKGRPKLQCAAWSKLKRARERPQGQKSGPELQRSSLTSRWALALGCFAGCYSAVEIG